MNRLLFSVYLLRQEVSNVPSEMTWGLLSTLCFSGEQGGLNRKADFFSTINYWGVVVILFYLMTRYSGKCYDLFRKSMLVSSFSSSVNKQNKYIPYKYKIMKISLEWIFKNKSIIMGLKAINSIENIIKYYFKGLKVKMILKNIR